MTPGTDVGSATSLESFVASAFDGFAGDSGSSDDGAPSTTDDQASPGAQPVETDTAADVGPSDSEGDATDTDDSEHETPADPNAPLDSSTTAADDSESLVAAAVPFSYRVNGQERTFDDLKVIPGKGAVITDDALPKLQQRLSERDTLYENSQQQYQKYQQLESLTAYKTVGADGKEQVLTGAPAIEAQRVTMARTEAILNTIAEVFDNPNLFRSLLMVNEQNQVVADPNALSNLTTRAENAAMKAERGVQQQFQHQPVVPQSPQASQTPDVQAVAPTVVENTAKQLGVSSLTSDDKTFLAEMLPRFVRPATHQDVALSPSLKLGEPVVDSAFGDLLQRQATLQTNSAKTVQAASTVSKENAARLAAAKVGKTVVQSHTRNAPTRPAPKVDQRAKDADDAWTMMENLAAGRF